MKYLIVILLFLIFAVPVGAIDYPTGLIIITIDPPYTGGSSHNKPICEKCWGDLTESDYTDHRYVPGGRVYVCPHCGYSNKENQLGYLEYLMRQGYENP